MHGQPQPQPHAPLPPPPSPHPTPRDNGWQRTRLQQHWALSESSRRRTAAVMWSRSRSRPAVENIGETTGSRPLPAPESTGPRRVAEALELAAAAAAPVRSCMAMCVGLLCIGPIAWAARKPAPADIGPPAAAWAATALGEPKRPICPIPCGPGGI